MNTPSRVSRDTFEHRRADLGVAAWGTAARARGRPSGAPARRWSAPRSAPSCVTSPSRRTVTVSQIAKISSRRCEMNSTAAPRSRSARTTPNSRSTSWPDSAAVGSSMISTRASKRERLGDLDDLLVGDREAAHGLLGVEAHAEAVHQLLDAVRCSARAVDAPQRAERVAAHHHVLRHREVGEERRLLIDHGDAGVARVGRAVEVDRRAVDQHVARRPAAARRRACARSSTCPRRSRRPAPAPRRRAARSTRPCAARTAP